MESRWDQHIVRDWLMQTLQKNSIIALMGKKSVRKTEEESYGCKKGF
jgi:hypothetical protein